MCSYVSLPSTLLFPTTLRALGLNSFFSTFWQLLFDPATQARRCAAQLASSRNQQWRIPKLPCLLTCFVEVTELAVGTRVVGCGTSEHGAFLNTSVLFHISLMAVAGQGVAGGGVDRCGVSTRDMFGFPFYRDERTCVCQIGNP